MHLVNGNANSARNSTSAIQTGVPMSYPLAMNGYNMGYLGANAAAQAAAAAAKKAAAAQAAADKKAAAAAQKVANQAAAAQKKADNQVATAQKKDDAAQKAIDAAQKAQAAAVAHGNAAAAAKDQGKIALATQHEAAAHTAANQAVDQAQKAAVLATTQKTALTAAKAVAVTSATAAKTAKTAGAAAVTNKKISSPADDAAAQKLKTQLDSMKAASQSKLNAKKAQLAQIQSQIAAKQSKRGVRGMGGLLGFIGGLFGMRQYDFDNQISNGIMSGMGAHNRTGTRTRPPLQHPMNRTRRGTHGFLGLGDTIDPVTGAVIPDGTGLPAPLTTATGVDPVTGQPVPIDPTTGLPIASAGPYGSIATPTADPTQDPMMAMVMEMMQSSQNQTPPKGCKPGSNKPACIMYYSSQQNQQMLMLVLSEISSMNQQMQQVDQMIMSLLQQLNQPAAQQYPAGTTLDVNGNPILPGVGATQAPLPPGYGIDPTTGALVPMSAPYDPSSMYTPQQALPVAAAYGSPAAMEPMPYAPGGSVDPYSGGDPSAGQYASMPMDQYPGMPPMPYGYGGSGDVSQIPAGFSQGDGGGGAGQDYIPMEIPINQGPMAYTDWNNDVASLPQGAMDTSGNDFIPDSVDPYDAMPDLMMAQQMQQPDGSMQAQQQMTPAQVQQTQQQTQQQALQQQAMVPNQVAMLQPPPMNLVSQGSQQMPDVLGAEDQGQILAESFGDASDMGA